MLIIKDICRNYYYILFLKDFENSNNMKYKMRGVSLKEKEIIDAIEYMQEY